jgi:magnesium transporter
VGDIVQGLDAAARDRIDQLRGEDRFFWVDVRLGDVTREDLRSALGIPDPALVALTGFGHDRPPMRKFHAGEGHVVFAFSAYSGPEPVEVHVLVTGDYLLTLHEERLSLPELLEPFMPEVRSERYIVYAVLEGMVGSAFDALSVLELSVDDLAVTSTDLRAGRLRMATLRTISSRLSRMRRRFGPQRGVFERIGDEVARLEGLETDSERYLDRVGQQINRLVDEIDAAANALATLIDLRLNETNYWLTVVATIFLPLTFITGFFGMNFEWMVKAIDTQLAFWLLGVGSLVVGVLLILRVVARGSPDGEQQI